MTSLFPSVRDTWYPRIPSVMLQIGVMRLWSHHSLSSSEYRNSSGVTFLRECARNNKKKSGDPVCIASANLATAEKTQTSKVIGLTEKSYIAPPMLFGVNIIGLTSRIADRCSQKRNLLLKIKKELKNLFGSTFCVTGIFASMRALLCCLESTP